MKVSELKAKICSVETTTDAQVTVRIDGQDTHRPGVKAYFDRAGHLRLEVPALRSEQGAIKESTASLYAVYQDNAVFIENGNFHKILKAKWDAEGCPTRLILRLNRSDTDE